jgi:hypothetical protein
MRNEFRFALALVLVAFGAPRAQAQDVTDDGRVGVVVAHPRRSTIFPARRTSGSMIKRAA